MATAGFSESIGWRPKYQPWLCFVPAMAALAGALISQPITPAGSWRQFQLDSLGWLSFGIGAAFRWWGTFYLASSPRGMLVTSGPYSICRHPVQIGNLLLGLSLVLFVGSWTFALGSALTAVAYLAVVVRDEQRTLIHRFGLEYRAYCRRVPGFWIRPGLFQSQETIFIDGVALWRELRRTTLWMWLPVIGKIFAQIRAESWLPHLLGMP